MLIFFFLDYQQYFIRLMTNDDVAEVADVFAKCFVKVPIIKASGLTYDVLLIIGKERASASVISGYAFPIIHPFTHTCTPTSRLSLVCEDPSNGSKIVGIRVCTPFMVSVFSVTNSN